MAENLIYKNDSYIYVLTDGLQHFKIGRTCQRHFRKRIEEIQTGNPFLIFEVFKWSCPSEFAPEMELMVHQLLASYRMKGEWFNTSEDVILDAVNHCINYFRNRNPSRDKAIDDLFEIAQNMLLEHRIENSIQASLLSEVEEDIAECGGIFCINRSSVIGRSKNRVVKKTNYHS